MTAARTGVLCFMVAVGLGASIDARLPASAGGLSLNDSLYRILGSAKEAIGDTLFLRADEYYHGGVLEKFEEDDHSKEGHIGGPARPPAKDWVARVNDRIRAHEHYHLTRDRQKEMLPFMALATTLDPYNVEAALTTAYWLESQFGRLDEAVELLERASADNPGSWELPFRAGTLHYKKKGDYARAVGYLTEALRRAEGRPVERFYLVDMHYFLAECLLRLDRAMAALPHYRRALALYGAEESVRIKDLIAERIRSVEAGEPLVWAEERSQAHAS